MFGIRLLGRYHEYSGLLPGGTADPKKTERMQTSFWQLTPPPPMVQLPEMGVCKRGVAPAEAPAPQEPCNLPHIHIDVTSLENSACITDVLCYRKTSMRMLGSDCYSQASSYGPVWLDVQ